MILKVTPRSDLSDMEIGEDYSYEIDLSKRLKSKTVDSYTYKVYNSSDIDVTSTFGGGSIRSGNVITFGIKAISAGEFSLVFAITCTETLPDSTPYEFFVTMTLKVT